ncbi:MAG: uroporphyrinogen-III synthase [Hyphomicrobiaceae bacterium]|nr:uroporphyrinogen-III synthase [Hyphomicrobiaceae bacterium]
MHILVTRPAPDGATLKQLIESAGHQASLAPLMSVAFDRPLAEELEGITGLVATSRNALRALAGTEALDVARGLTVFAVGAGTAEQARSMGFARVVKGPGTAEALGPLIASIVDPAEEVLLHLAGEQLSRDLVGELSLSGLNISSRIVYGIRPARELPEAVRSAIRVGVIDAVMLMSPQTAAIWSRLVRLHGLESAAREIIHLCLSSAVAGRLTGLGTVPTGIAGEPTLEEMLALADLAAAKSAR